MLFNFGFGAVQARGILVDLVERFLTSMIEYVFILLAIIGLAAAEKRASQSLPKKLARS